VDIQEAIAETLLPLLLREQKHCEHPRLITRSRELRSRVTCGTYPFLLLVMSPNKLTRKKMPVLLHCFQNHGSALNVGWRCVLSAVPVAMTQWVASLATTSLFSDLYVLAA
jgi:hypothetical protein